MTIQTHKKNNDNISVGKSQIRTDVIKTIQPAVFFLLKAIAKNRGITIDELEDLFCGTE